MLVLYGGITLGVFSLARRVDRFDKLLSSKLNENATQLHKVEEQMLTSIHKLSADLRSWSRDIAAHSLATNQRIDRANTRIDSVASTKLA